MKCSGEFHFPRRGSQSAEGVTGGPPSRQFLRKHSSCFAVSAASQLHHRWTWKLSLQRLQLYMDIIFGIALLPKSEYLHWSELPWSQGPKYIKHWLKNMQPVRFHFMPHQSIPRANTTIYHNAYPQCIGLPSCTLLAMLPAVSAPWRLWLFQIWDHRNRSLQWPLWLSQARTSSENIDRSGG